MSISRGFIYSSPRGDNPRAGWYIYAMPGTNPGPYPSESLGSEENCLRLLIRHL